MELGFKEKERKKKNYSSISTKIEIEISKHANFFLRIANRCYCDLIF